ncbi:MAG: LamG-like jellyroll fold domain-containing protein, partial [Opitutae bacterium]
PKIILDMLSDARSDLEKGSGYVRNPGVNYTYSSTFANYRTRVVDTYLGMLEYLQEHQSMMLSSSPIDINATQDYNTQRLDLLEYLEDESLIRFDDFNNTTQTNLISRPYAKALMQETGITRARVGPREINEFGAFLAYGGRGYDRNDTPEVEVRRASIWEDYNKTDANATAYVDGVGTISPVIANSFMGNVWESRPGDSVVPHVVVWGSGGGDLQDPDSEVEANVTNWMDDGAYMRTITIYNQGKGFEPNSTMAVLHYPVEPFAYWSFDRHESLFEDMNNSRHQPNPGWNLEPDAVNLKHYWRFDTNTSGGSDNEINASARFSGTQMLNENSFKNWGLLGKAIEVNSTNEVHALRVLDENFTLSMWVKPEGDFEMNFTKTGERVIYRDSSRDYELSDSGEFLEAKVEDYWTHIGIVSDEGLATLFIDGRASSSQQTITASDLNITSTNTLLLDDVRIYDVPLSDAEVRYLAGRTYLDLSGNQYHAAPMGSTDFLPISPESVTAGDGKVPEFSPYPNSTNGSGRLGDSFSGELNGLSLQFDGASDYLDLSTHSLEFGLPAGTFSVWVKTTSSQSPNPLFWLSSPPIIDVFTDTDTNETEITITPGSFFALELSNGLPRLGGIGANSPSNRVNDGQWHHIAASFPFGQIWVDGTVVSTSNYDLQDTLYEGFDNLFSFSADADTMNIGRAMDRTIRDQEIFFNGRMDDFILYD